jgi:transcriptional regulator with XRE-family HTH domain
MDTMERDPTYIAEQVRLIRKAHRLTQENLADAAGLSTRTIEKIESGRHPPNEQTLRSIARVVGWEVSAFEKPTPEQEERLWADLLKAQRKTVFAPIHPVRTATDFLSAFAQVFEAFRMDTSAVADEAALDVAATMTDWVTDCGDIWDEIPMSGRVDLAREFAELCEQIEALGYVCYMGGHRQQLRQRDGSRMIFTVGLMTILHAKDEAETRYAMVELDGAWETMEEDRVSLAAFERTGSCR